MMNEYKEGRTPNPDVMCNKHVKFGVFYDWAMKEGADFVATGHYARIAKSKKEIGDQQVEAKEQNSKQGTQNLDASFSLLAGEDTNKDQSYFLWTLKKDQLSHVLFPVGDISKPEVRKLAATFKLPNAEKKDSQGLCFIGKVDVKEFLSHYVQVEKGDVLDLSGKVIGTHPGALFFTIGERRGFTITEKTPNDAACYVVGKDITKNTITVSDKNEDSLPGALNNVKITHTNWISEIPQIGKGLQARSRYRQPLHEIEITSLHNDTATIQFTEPQDTLTPGQSIVIYSDEVCVGGGIIE